MTKRKTSIGHYTWSYIPECWTPPPNNTDGLIAAAVILGIIALALLGGM